MAPAKVTGIFFFVSISSSLYFEKKAKAPRRRVIFTKALPRNVDIVTSVCPTMAEYSDIVISGSAVPILTNVNPIKNPLIFNFFANANDCFTNRSADQRRAVK